MKALVIDDSKTMRLMIKKILQEMGHAVREAADSDQAFTLLSVERGFGVLLVDWNLPGMNGIDFVTSIRANSEYKSLPIIMVTSETELPNIQRALSAGVNEYIMKPFKKESVQEKFALLGLEGR